MNKCAAFVIRVPPEKRQKKKPNPNTYFVVRFRFGLVELKAAKTHTVIYKINRREFYCAVDLPLSDYPLYGKQLVARG